MGRTVERTDRSEPWQIQFYDPAVRDILERAKQFSYCDAASVNAFPLRAQFNIKAAEYVEEAISERQSQGLFVGEGMVSYILIVQLMLSLSQVGGLSIATTYVDWYVRYFYSAYDLQWHTALGGPWELAFGAEEESSCVCRSTLQVGPR